MSFEKIFGIDIAVGTRDALFLSVKNLLFKGGAVFTVNPEILYHAAEIEELRDILNTGLNIPDGIGVVRALRHRGVICDTLPGVELGEALLDAAPVSFGIIGGKAGVAADAADMLIMRHPTAYLSFTCDGYSYDEEEIRERLKTDAPDILFVCLGSPKQEIFISRMMPYAPKTLFLALGGSADIYSGRKRRAPKLFRRLGLEWLFRIIKEPSRIFRLPSLFGFVSLFAKEEKKRQKTNEKGKI